MNFNIQSSESRIASILEQKEMRTALAEQADFYKPASARHLDFSTKAIIDFLGDNRSVEETTAFFSNDRVSEAIILLTARPVLLVQNGLIEKASLKEIEDKLVNVRDTFVSSINSVGRIELIDHDNIDWCGTGWRVEDEFIITNRHVANLFAERQGTKFKFRTNQRGKFLRARIDFLEEFNGADSEEFAIAEVVWISEDSSSAPDIAVLKVKQDASLPSPLILADKDIDYRESIGVVGYPAKDSRNNSAAMADIFKDIYDVKRFAPGEVVSKGDASWFFTHDATTLGGNSGSAVFDLENQKVVGLHFGGEFRKNNYAVKASVIKNLLARKSWVPVTKESINIPSEKFKEETRTLETMQGRKGYDPSFLGKIVPIPVPGSSHAVLTDDPLPYTHFSIVMSKHRRFPIVTAENLDGAKKIKLKRKDSWGYDPRIPKEAQVGHEEFYRPEPFDKGHMVRRENPGWGEDEAEARLGEDDTFIYTNAIPQMPQLNQKTWLSLEDYVLDNAKTTGFKINVFTGPVFRDDDPKYANYIQVPLDFWKIVVAIDDENKDLLVSGYLLSQEGLMPLEGFRYGPFKTYQVPVSRIANLADLTLAEAITNADVFNSEEVSEMINSARYLEITSADDLVLTKDRSI